MNSSTMSDLSNLPLNTAAQTSIISPSSPWYCSISNPIITLSLSKIVTVEVGGAKSTSGSSLRMSTVKFSASSTLLSSVMGMSAHALEVVSLNSSSTPMAEKSAGSVEEALSSLVDKVNVTVLSSDPLVRMAHTSMLPSPSFTVYLGSSKPIEMPEIQ